MFLSPKPVFGKCYAKSILETLIKFFTSTSSHLFLSFHINPLIKTRPLFYLSAFSLNDVILDTTHRYLDQLGMASVYNTKTYCRQTLIGGNYGLLNTTTFLPNPNYYRLLNFF